MQPSGFRKFLYLTGQSPEFDLLRKIGVKNYISTLLPSLFLKHKSLKKKKNHGSKLSISPKC